MLVILILINSFIFKFLSILQRIFREDIPGVAIIWVCFDILADLITRVFWLLEKTEFTEFWNYTVGRATQKKLLRLSFFNLIGLVSSTTRIWFIHNVYICIWASLVRLTNTPKSKNAKYTMQRSIFLSPQKDKYGYIQKCQQTKKSANSLEHLDVYSYSFSKLYLRFLKLLLTSLNIAD